MINTVLGEIKASDLGMTLMHEHVNWDWDGAESVNQYSVEEVVNTMLPYLLDLKNSGCSTFVDATTYGAGRDINVLVECAKKSGLNILTNTGIWDGGKESRKYTPVQMRNMGTDEIAEVWTSEFFYGIEGTDVKPAFIKIAVGDTGKITDFQEKLLRAAARTSIRTKLPVQCHTFSANSAFQAINIIEEEKLPLNKFIWVHADGEYNYDAISLLAEKGIWVELDCIARRNDFSWYIQTIKKIIKGKFTDRLLISQDAGAFYFGERNDETTILPYSRIFKEFIPTCICEGISQELFQEVLLKNPQCLFK